jgi:hypothetical protein
MLCAHQLRRKRFILAENSDLDYLAPCRSAVIDGEAIESENAASDHVLRRADDVVAWLKSSNADP